MNNPIIFIFKSEVRFVMANLHVDFNVPYKDQDVNLVSKIIKRVGYLIIFL